MTETGPKPRCSACDVQLVPAHMGGSRLMIGPVGGKRRNAAEPRVCPRCGRVEFFSVEPALFRELADDEVGDR